LEKLAILGGKPLKDEYNKTFFSAQLSIDEEEIEAVQEVMKTRHLSGYRGNWNKQFWGGEQVVTFERDLNYKFGPWALAVNSCTSALQIACGAIGLEPDDEVIVTPWSMSCSATAPLVWGAKPVFADIERDYFCLDPESIKRQITKKTRAIIVVDLFGQPYDYSGIGKIAKDYGLIIIEDAAQAIGSKCNDIYAGAIGDIGCFSFTQGKHLTAGEGGAILAIDTYLHNKCALIRNHAEAVISAQVDIDPEEVVDDSLYGFNMRMTEIQGAILQEQLKKLDAYIAYRRINVDRLNNIFTKIPSIKPVKTREGCTHSYYVQGFYWDKEAAHGLTRDAFVKALSAELPGELGRPDKPLLGCGYIKPLYRMPVFKNYGINPNDYPVVEKLWKEDFFLSMLHSLPLGEADFDLIDKAITKVWENRWEII
jgi:dTDP-4-amino-4,6-dideoxygalactose transaminase